MHKWIGSALVQVVACCLFGVKHYLNQHWFIVNWTLIRHKLQWNFNQNRNIFIHEYASENIICKIAANLSRERWVNSLYPSDTCFHDMTLSFFDWNICHRCSNQRMTMSCHENMSCSTDRLCKKLISQHWIPINKPVEQMIKWPVIWYAMTFKWHFCKEWTCWYQALWCHQMESFSALLAVCEGNPPVTGKFPSQGPATLSFDISFDMHPKTR